MQNLKLIQKFFISHLFLTVSLLVLLIFFKPFIFENKLPVPADTIVGMYHPWRDVVWDNFTAGVPFRNFLITDPVRQQYPWRELAVSLAKQGELPLWNPYNFAGTPLLANFQSAPFYIFNFLFFIFDFSTAWGLLIFLQPLLAAVFLYLYLSHLRLNRIACLTGALSFSFSGFFIAWLEWGTILHSVLWLPLILLSIEKIIYYFRKLKFSKSFLIWSIIFIFSLVSSFFAGHLQVFFYVFLFSFVYLIWRLSQLGSGRLRLFLLFTIYYLLFTIAVFIQWLPTLEFIKLSARNLDQLSFDQPGWFIPWQNLVQFFAPDFFGNPTTLNYWGVFNYGEFVGYIGVIPLIFALYAIFWGRDRKTIFFASLLLIALSFALATPWAKLPYKLGVPLISTSQPTRLLFVVDFCLAILAVFGLDAFLREKVSLKKIILSLIPFFLLSGFLWMLVVGAGRILPNASWIANFSVSKRNLILPTTLLTAFTILVVVYFILIYDIKGRKFFSVARAGFIGGILFLIIFDLLRFGWKFTPFTKEEWIFPPTETIKFLKKDKNPFRFMSTDRRIFPPNFSAAYRLQTVDGYDPLYLSRYGELIAASERGKPDISAPFGFNRIITPQNYESKIIDLLNVKYILSLTDLNSPKLKKVFQEGQTQVYENKNVLPRAFFVEKIDMAKDKNEAINKMFKNDLQKTAIIEDGKIVVNNNLGIGNVKIFSYTENKVILQTSNNKDGFLVLADSYYPTWQAEVDGRGTKIYRVDYNLRGIIVPQGEHKIEFKMNFFQ